MFFGMTSARPCSPSIYRKSDGFILLVVIPDPVPTFLNTLAKLSIRTDHVWSPAPLHRLRLLAEQNRAIGGELADLGVIVAEFAEHFFRMLG